MSVSMTMSMSVMIMTNFCVFDDSSSARATVRSNGLVDDFGFVMNYIDSSINVANFFDNLCFVMMNMLDWNDDFGFMEMMNLFDGFNNDVFVYQVVRMNWLDYSNFLASVIDVSYLFDDIGLVMMNVFDWNDDLCFVKMMNLLGWFDHYVLVNNVSSFDRSRVDNLFAIIDVTHLFDDIGFVMMDVFYGLDDLGFVEMMNSLNGFDDSIFGHRILDFDGSNVGDLFAIINMTHLFDDIGFVMMDVFHRLDDFGFVEMMNCLNRFYNSVFVNCGGVGGNGVFDNSVSGGVVVVLLVQVKVIHVRVSE